MFSSLRWLALLLVCLVGIGLYRGWFSFSRPSPDPQNHEVNVNLSIDTTKLKADVEKAEQFTEKVAQKIKDRRDAAKAAEVK